MKRVGWLAGLVLFGLAARGLAYDGPPLLTYDETNAEGVRVVFTTQAQVIPGGWTRLTVVAHVPITSADVDQELFVEARKSGSDALLTECLFYPQASDVGSTVAYPCDEFTVIPYSASEGSTISVYPVVRVGGLEHRFRSLPATVVNDDNQEPNDTLGAPRNLGVVTTVTLRDLIARRNNPDYFAFQTPNESGVGSASFLVENWDTAGFPEVTILDDTGEPIGTLEGFGDGQRLTIPVTPNTTLYIWVQNPAESFFYDLSVQVGGPDIVTIHTPPSGNPNPVASGGTTTLSVGASDSLGHPLSYLWIVRCPGGMGSGSFFPSRAVQSPQWTAPPNYSGVPRDCDFTVEVSDPGGVTATDGFAMTVLSAPHDVVFTTPAAGSPNPVASSGAAALSAEAVDPLGHPLAYTWTATCPGLPTTGTFTPSNTVQLPSWTAPANLTDALQTCTLAVTASDGSVQATSSYQQQVDWLPHTLTVSSPASGTPNPVPPGEPVQLSVTFVDSHGHLLSYLWTSACPGLTSSGSFSPSNTSAAPQWIAPANQTGQTQACTIQVTANDGRGLSRTSSYEQGVTLSAHTLSVTGPSASPNPVVGGTSTSLQVTATDSYGHPLTYSWTASCPTLPSGGTFQPSASIATPSWVAPQNTSGTSASCSLSVTVSDGQGLSETRGLLITVAPTPDAVTITSPASATPSALPSGATTNLSVAATDAYGHTLSYAWTAQCPGLTGAAPAGTFQPSASVQSPSWVAPANQTPSLQVCNLSVFVSDGQGQSASSGTSVTVSTAPHTLVITDAAVGVPNPTASGASAALSVTAVDSYAHPLSYAWTASCPGLPSNGTFLPNASERTPSWNAPQNATGAQQACTIQVTVSDGQGLSQTSGYTQSVSLPSDSITITVAPSGAPDPVGSGGTVTLSVAATDSQGHPLTYTWGAACATLPANGSFPSGNVGQTLQWNAPVNATGSQQICALTVTVTDGQGQQVTASRQHRVDSAPDALTITSPAAGTPDPSPSDGAVTLSVQAADALNHPISYSWTAACDGLPTNGAFSDTASRTPTWTAPRNLTGVQRSCTIAVTASDGRGQQATSSYSQEVNPAEHTLTITAPATSSQSPVPSGGTVTLGVVAQDSYGHPLSYAWSSACSGLPDNGVFSDAASRTPAWKAPQNQSPVQGTCTISVVVSDGGGGKTAASSVTQLVDGAAHTLTVTTVAGNPNPVAAGGSVQLAATAYDSHGHALAYAWTATCPGLSSNGQFAGADSSSPTWTAPVNATQLEQLCTIEVTATDSVGVSAKRAFAQAVWPPDALIITKAASGDPRSVVSNGTVQLNVEVRDTAGHALAYGWTVFCGGSLGPGALDDPTRRNPVWTAPLNRIGNTVLCVMTVRITDGYGQEAVSAYLQEVQDADAPPHIMTATTPTSTPNPVVSEGVVTLGVSAQDTYEHLLSYLWSASCPGLPTSGEFLPNPWVQMPTWVAPENRTRQVQPCTLTVIVRDGQGLEKEQALEQRVSSASNTISITGIDGWPNPVASRGQVALSTDASAPLGGLTFAWTAVCPGSVSNGTFNDPASPTPVWTAPGNPTSGSRTCTISVAVTDGVEPAQQASYEQVVRAGTTSAYYFAEGATVNGFFDTRFAFLNPSASDAAVQMEFQLKDASTVLTHAFPLRGGHHATKDVRTLAQGDPALAALASAEFSTVVRSDVPIAVDRTMTWDATRYGSHAETSIAAPASTWYLAEGATIAGFDLYYLIQNPNATELKDPVTGEGQIEVEYLLPPPAQPIVRRYSLGPNTRGNIAVHLEPGLEDVEVSAIIRTPADKPVIVERAMYLSSGGLYYGAGHESAGVRTPATQWFFAEGATGDFFDLFILVANPNPTPAQITATYLFEDGTTCSRSDTVGARSRYNIWVDVEQPPGCPKDLAHAALSTTITADQPVIAERTMWWPGPTAATWAEAHNAPGATETGTLWALADGEDGGLQDAETYVLVANTSAVPGLARVTVYFEDGTSATQDVALPPNSRTNVPMRSVFGAAVAGRTFGTTVESLPAPGQADPAQIVVERAMYANGPGAVQWAAGTNVLATRIR